MWPDVTEVLGAQLRKKMTYMSSVYHDRKPTFYVGWYGDPLGTYVSELWSSYYKSCLSKRNDGTVVWRVTVTNSKTAGCSTVIDFVGRKEYRPQYGPGSQRWLKFEATLLAVTLTALIT